MNAAHPQPPDVMAYLDGEAPANEAHDIQAHVASCVVCQQLVTDLREGSRQMREWQVEGPPSSLIAPTSRGRSNTRLPLWASLRSLVWSAVAARPLLTTAGILVVLAAAVVLQSEPRKTVRRISLGDPRALAEGVEKPETQIAASRAESFRPGLRQMNQQSAPESLVQTGPRIVRTATLRIVATNFGGVRSNIDRILQASGGLIGGITASDRPGATRSIRGTLRIPRERLDGVLASLRALGRVTEDSQAAEDVTATVVDLDVRLSNARVTEKRLSQVLQNRTGGVSDVLEVEREIARVRTDIEQMETQRKQLDDRIEYATVTLEVTEERAAEVNLGPIPVPIRLRHAIADGVESAAMSMLEATLFVLQRGPAALLWISLLGLPAWWLSRKYVMRVNQRPGGV